MENKLSSRPPTPKSVEEFIAAADKKPTQEKVKELTWLREGVRPDLKRCISLFLYEPYIMKLKFISENSSYSQQAFARKSLEKAIDDKIEQLLP